MDERLLQAAADARARREESKRKQQARKMDKQDRESKRKQQIRKMDKQDRAREKGPGRLPASRRRARQLDRYLKIKW